MVARCTGSSPCGRQRDPRTAARLLHWNQEGFESGRAAQLIACGNAGNQITGAARMSLDVCVVGELNPDLILYGVPPELKPEEEALINGFRLTLGSSSAIFAHNLAVLGTRVGLVAKIGADSFGKMASDWLGGGGGGLTRVRLGSGGPTTGPPGTSCPPGPRFFL